MKNADVHLTMGVNIREYPGVEDDQEELLMAQESRTKLIEYLKKYKVKQIYPCWADDEAKSQQGQKTITIEKMKNNNFIFKDRELITIIE